MTEATLEKTALRQIDVLIVADHPEDAELSLRELKRVGFDARADVVHTAHEFCARLTAKPYQVILADYMLAAWTGLEALELLHQMKKEIPFILVAGPLSDGVAVNCLTKGVTDFVHRDHLALLPVAVERALQAKALREERDRAEEKWREAEDRCQRLAPKPVLEFSREGELIYFNEAAGELAKLLGHDHPESFLPAEAGSIVQMCLTTGQVKQGLETSIQGRTFSWLFFPVRPKQVVHCYIEEITERLSLEAQLRHSQSLESVGRLASGVAHDFNNIITVIQGHTGLLRSAPNLSPELGESLQQISRATERAGKLTSQLLTFSRKTVPRPARLNVNEVLTNLSMLLHRTLGEDITFQFNYAPDLPAIFADAGMIDQIILILAVNARDAMPKGGQLVISTSVVEVDARYVERHPDAHVGRFVCLTVIDTGCGMDDVTLGRIFEPFFTTKQFGKGTGLGLATVYGIVKQHEGWVEVQSQVGQGSTFRVFLPPDSRSSEVKTETPAEPRKAGGDETVLVVEDEPPVRWIVKNVLERAGYQVLEAGSGVEALAVWHQHQARIALLLTDLVMPVGLSGQELGEKFKAQKGNLKVIYTSGYSVEVAGKGLHLTDGLNFLQKPFDAARLTQAVRSCLDS